ncbi:MAG: glycosyltransferase family 2 protein [Paludibacter sp.]
MLLSIITINRNNFEGLRKTIESVVSQTFNDFEYIVIDGASTDGSVAIVNEYATKISYWVSEPDKGIYNAMNKGIVKANGEYCLFLNSGDEFESPSSLQTFISCVYEHVDIIYGNILVKGDTVEYVKSYPDKVTFSYFLRESLAHPASLIRRELLLELGKYDEELKICSDWAFFVKAICLKNCSYKHLDITLSTFYLDGFSSDSVNAELIEQEKKRVINESFAAFYEDYQRLESLEKFKAKFMDLKLVRGLKKIGLLK